jgi:hypothetical protein
VWNQTERPERVFIAIDETSAYSGVLGTLDSFPKIVFRSNLMLPLGEHRLVVRAPERGFERTLPFSVTGGPLNLHVMLNVDEVLVDISRQVELYM